MLVHTDEDWRIEDVVEADWAFQLLLHLLVPAWQVFVPFPLCHYDVFQQRFSQIWKYRIFKMQMLALIHSHHSSYNLNDSLTIVLLITV